MAAVRRERRRSNQALAVLGCVGVVVSALAVSGRWLPGLAQSNPRVKELDLTSRSAGADSDGEDSPPPGSCQAALTAGLEVFAPVAASWSSASERGRLLSKFGRLAVSAEERAMSAFDDEAAEPAACRSQRAALESAIRSDAWAAFLAMRALLEEDVRAELADDLLAGMRRRGAPLRVQEKVDMLRAAVASYRKQVKQLLPEWAISRGDPEQAETERRLGELQFGIEDSMSGRQVQMSWEQKRNKRLMSERAHGMSVSVDPALRVMMRPEGLGNFQVFSQGPVGPPNSPAEVNIGIMNDGSMADVYREHPEPPIIALQPAMKVNLDVR
mmetsp:Transcript_56838/g.144081  ORF Transcript_56838/g.144081 Transcript_56838/m.144081 type:complete len:328 (-) Transcript_56838:63-1046(-)|eukprot:CAMPEP_0115207148 /NCGR_PEP_ID=MMETSP0270-20121206/20570_1 /TAXON_ID=71861 /ORGANISM="Scrippsiella trochoidea, Strain CCMP3099" /LENGTH=327 /DNA_ID=CAMNT_0002620739 /DNA_START=78 /DNA_END=1061 /DNA_ORIENTATION=+